METNERALLRSKEGEKSVSIDCLPIFLPLLQDESSKILPENRSSSNFSPHLETYVQFRPHDRKRLLLSSYPLVSSLPSLLSVMYQTARIFFRNERNSYVTLSIVLIRKREKRYLRKTFSYFPPFPSPIPPSVEGAPDSVSRNPHGLETRSPGFFAANRTISQLDRNA